MRHDVSATPTCGNRERSRQALPNFSNWKRCSPRHTAGFFGLTWRSTTPDCYGIDGRHQIPMTGHSLLQNFLSLERK
jgi:hypothetical protein